MSPLAAALNADHWTKPWRPDDSDSAKLEEELPRQFLCNVNARTAIAALKLGPTNTIDAQSPSRFFMSGSPLLPLRNSALCSAPQQHVARASQ